MSSSSPASLILFTLERQRKTCGHDCFPSTTAHCCACSDLRPHRQGHSYPVYVDGEGWRDCGSRDDGYCPVCNPKNYDLWTERIAIKQKEKAIQQEKLRVLLEQQNIEASDDMLTIFQDIGDRKGKYLYHNGDEYEGEFLSGQRHGQGTIVYASDSSCYEGDWFQNMQHGHGKQSWGDGIEYIGQWKEGKMHGQGRYTLSCGSVIEGLFENDEFAG